MKIYFMDKNDHLTIFYRLVKYERYSCFGESFQDRMSVLLLRIDFLCCDTAPLRKLVIFLFSRNCFVNAKYATKIINLHFKLMQTYKQGIGNKIRQSAMGKNE